MRGGYLVWILVLLFVGIVGASVNGIDLTLDRTVYGAGQDIGGNLVINTDEGDEVSVHEQIGAAFVDCGDGDGSWNYVLYDLLNDAGLFSGLEYMYSQGNQRSVLDEEGLYGFRFSSSVDELEFDLSGEGGPFFIDVGNDGVADWQYISASDGFGNLVYPGGFENINLPNNPDERRLGNWGVCNWFDFEVNEFLDSFDIKVNAYAKRETVEGWLGAGVDGGDDCILSGNGWEDVSTDWVLLSCEVTKELNSNHGNLVSVEVCLRSHPSGNDDFLVPVFSGEDDEYFYITLNGQIFSTDLPSQTVSIKSDSLVSAINDYECENSDNCLVPFRPIIGNVVGGDEDAEGEDPEFSSFGNFIMDNLNLSDYGGNIRHSFYDVVESSNVVVLDGLNIPLDVFGLDVPNIVIDECSFEIEFGEQSDLEVFEIREAPNAIINIDSIYFLQNQNILFDGSESNASGNSTIDSYFWDFGDGTNSSSVSPTKFYPFEGEYNITLTIKDSGNVTATDSITIYIVDFEEHIENRIIEIRNGLSEADVNFYSVSDSEQIVLDLFDVDFVILPSLVDGLEANFTSIRDNADLTEAYRNSVYGVIATELGDIAMNTPADINLRNTTSVGNYNLALPSDVDPYSGVSSLTNEQRSEIYEFNRDNVNVDAKFELFNIDFIDGWGDYILVNKDVTVSGGSNDVLVEYLSDYDLEKMFYNGASEDTSYGNLYWSVYGSVDINYLVESSELEVIKSVVFSDVEHTDGISSSDCVCGDGKCTKISKLSIDESDKSSSYYCAEDCGGKIPVLWLTVLGAILLFGLLYFWLYKGPGNLQSLSNKLTFKLFRKKLFVTDRDKVVLTNYINHAFRRGFTRIEIRTALIKKGWNGSQIDEIFRNL